jgi:hypothetical protein
MAEQSASYAAARCCARPSPSPCWGLLPIRGQPRRLLPPAAPRRPRRPPRRSPTTTYDSKVRIEGEAVVTAN